MTVDHNILQFGIVRLPLASGRASSLDDEPKSMLAVVRIFFKSALVEPMCIQSRLHQDGYKFIFSIPSSTSNRGGRGRRDRLILAHYRCSRGSVLRCWRERKQSNIVFPFLSVIIILILYEVE